jgi:hypothetical protein
MVRHPCTSVDGARADRSAACNESESDKTRNYDFSEHTFLLLILYCR